MGADDHAERDLAILVCSANVGNAEPTPESFGEWIPNDGEISGPLTKTKYPVDNGVDNDDSKKVLNSLLQLGDGGKKKNKQFDIIVIGMQEAAFVDKSKSTKHKNSGGDVESGTMDASNRSGADNSERDWSHVWPSTASAAVGEALKVVGGGVAEIETKGKKGKNKIFRKAVKASLLVRGLTTSQTYKAPALRNHSKGGDSKVKENSAVRAGSYDTRKFVELIEDRCPSYGLVTAKLRGEMRLIVLALKGLAEEITDVYIAGENTGIGSVLANKGGIIATFDLRGTRLSFMTAHLEAHEGATHYQNRNKHLTEIFAGAKTDPNYNLHDATIISHHMFVCGDLNYRINFGEKSNKKASKKPLNKVKSRIPNKMKASMTSNPSVSSPPPPLINETSMSLDTSEVASTTESIKSPTANSSQKEKAAATPDNKSPANGSHFAEAHALIEAEDWKTLNDGDELAMALKKKECLAGFKTLPCNWPPTFKVARCEGYQYNEKRTPSYTDRILWKSADGMGGNVVPFLYEPCPDFITSDHKPIRGGYMVKTNRGPPPKRPSQIAKPGHSERHVNILVSNIKCTNLPVMDAGVIGGLSDPYILFVSSPKPMLWKKAWPSTKVIKRELNPIWQEDMHLTLDDEDATCRDAGGTFSLAGSMLYMTVMDEDFSSGDDVIGTVALNLNDLCSDLKTDGCDESSTPSVIQKTEISRPILRNGQEFGMLECTISSAYLSPKEVRAFLKNATKKVRSKRREQTITNRLSALFAFA